MYELIELILKTMNLFWKPHYKGIADRVSQVA